MYYRVEALYKGIWRGMYDAPHYDFLFVIAQFIGVCGHEEDAVAEELCKEVQGWLKEPPEKAGSFPEETRYWFTEEGWKKFHTSGLVDWWLTSLDGGVEDVRVLAAKEPSGKVVFRDEHQIAC